MEELGTGMSFCEHNVVQMQAYTEFLPFDLNLLLDLLYFSYTFTWCFGENSL